jgi:RNase P subunit RPR2
MTLRYLALTFETEAWRSKSCTAARLVLARARRPVLGTQGVAMAVRIELREALARVTCRKCSVCQVLKSGQVP